MVHYLIFAYSSVDMMPRWMSCGEMRSKLRSDVNSSRHWSKTYIQSITQSTAMLHSSIENLIPILWKAYFFLVFLVYFSTLHAKRSFTSSIENLILIPWKSLFFSGFSNLFFYLACQAVIYFWMKQCLKVELMANNLSYSRFIVPNRFFIILTLENG